MAVGVVYWCYMSVVRCGRNGVMECVEVGWMGEGWSGGYVREVGSECSWVGVVLVWFGGNWVVVVARWFVASIALGYFDVGGARGPSCRHRRLDRFTFVLVRYRKSKCTA